MSCKYTNAGSIPATSTMEINKYITTELGKLDKYIVATPEDRDYLERFAGANGGSADLILMQMAIQFGYKMALENVQEILQTKHEQESII